MRRLAGSRRAAPQRGRTLLPWILAVLAACGDRSGQQLAQARALLQQHDRAAALVQVKAVVQEQPDRADARLLLGQVLLDSGQPVLAEIELRRAMALGTAPAQAVPPLARALLAAGQPGRLIAEFGTLAWPDAVATATLKTLVAEAQAQQGDLAAAQASLAEALRAAPRHEAALRLQARVTAVAGDLPGALAQVQQLTAGADASAEAWVLQGDLLARQGADPPAVAAAYQRALQRQPDLASAHAALISLHLAGRDIAAATAQFEDLRRRLPQHPQTVLYDGRLALLQGDLPRARGQFQWLLRGAPERVAVLQLAALTELRLGAPAQAEALLHKALQLAPDSAATRRLLAQAALAQGQPARVLALLQPLMAADHADAEALALAGQAQLLAGQGDQAAALFDRAAQARPDDVRIRTAVALGQLARGRDDQALAELQAVALADAGTTADLALIAAQMQRRAPAAALRAIDALEKKQPDQPMPALLRGQVLLGQQDAAAARQAFDQALARDQRYTPAVAALASLDLREGRPDDARARFEALLRLDPKNGAARQALAELAARSGAGREAVAALLEDAVKASPDDIARRLALIDHHLATHNAKAALVAAQTGLALQPEQFDLLGRLGQAQVQAGETQQALTTFNRMVVLQPRHASGYLGLAEAQLAAQDAGAASRTLRRGLEAVPGHLGLQRLAVTAALLQKQPAQALAIAREVQRQRPDLAVGLVMEGEIEMQRRRWDPAAGVLRQALAKAEPDVAAQRLHQALRQAGHTAEADTLARQWLAEHPRDTAFLFYLGDVALVQNDLATAEQRYQAVLKIVPEHAMSLNNIAWILLQQKRPGALPYAERAVRAAPDRPALMDTLALALAAENQPARAAALQQQALAMQPGDAFLRLNLARFLAQAGDKRAAKAELDRLAGLGDRFPRQDEVAALTQGLGGLPR